MLHKLRDLVVLIPGIVFATCESRFGKFMPAYVLMNFGSSGVECFVIPKYHLISSSFP